MKRPLSQGKSSKELEQVLYKQEFWDQTKGRFSGGAVKVRIKDAFKARYENRTNQVNGVPQWSIDKSIAPEHLEFEEIR